MDHCFIGLDGGGSKTAGALVTSAGVVLATASAGPSSIVGKPSPHACRVLRSLVGRLCRDAGLSQARLTGCGIGLSGIDFDDEFETQHSGLAAALQVPRRRLTLVNDGIAALWGATGSPAAVILQHGTGFTAAYRSTYGREALFDHLDAGRCFDLRWAALAAVARMIDGRAKPSALKRALLAAFDIEDESQYAGFVYRRQFSPEQWNRIAPAVFATWADGDRAAVAIVERAAADYASAVGAMIGKAGRGRPDVVFGGGVLTNAPERFWTRLTNAVMRDCPHAAVKRPALPPAIGAAIMAAFAAGHDPRRLFHSILLSTTNTRNARQ